MYVHAGCTDFASQLMWQPAAGFHSIDKAFTKNIKKKSKSVVESPENG